MKCFNEFSLDRLEDMLSTAKVPTCAETTKWITNKKKEIEKDFGNQIEDENDDIVEGEFEINSNHDLN